jgi:hypothetical protein
MIDMLIICLLQWKTYDKAQKHAIIRLLSERVAAHDDLYLHQPGPSVQEQCVRFIISPNSHASDVEELYRFDDLGPKKLLGWSSAIDALAKQSLSQAVQRKPAKPSKKDKADGTATPTVDTPPGEKVEEAKGTIGDCDEPEVAEAAAERLPLAHDAEEEQIVGMIVMRVQSFLFASLALLECCRLH